MRHPSFIAVMFLGLTLACAVPHPETGLEYWAIQAEPVPGEIVGCGRISKLSFEADDLGRPRETLVEVVIDRVFRGVKTDRVRILEDGKRFRDLVYNRRLNGHLVFILQPSAKRKGFMTYWDGFGVRELADGDADRFARRLTEWAEVGKIVPKPAKRVAMLEWGLRCVEARITRWEGVLAIRDAINPGAEYREHTEAMKAVTPERRDGIRAAYQRIRDEQVRDYRIGTVMMEALAWLTPDPLFHHEVRFWSAKLVNDEVNWKRHFDDFWTLAERHGSGFVSRGGN